MTREDARSREPKSTKLDSLISDGSLSPSFKAIPFKHYTPKEDDSARPSAGSNSDDDMSDTECLKSSHPRRTDTRTATLGDAVLIRFLGNHNHPELAQEAGEQPLRAHEPEDFPAADLDGEMLGGGNVTTNPTQLANLAAAASAELKEPKAVEVAGAQLRSHHHDPRPRPRLDTKINITDGPKPQYLHGDQIRGANTRRASVNDVLPAFLGHRANALISPSVNSPFNQSICSADDNDSISRSPMLRQHAISMSERSPMEILPRMQTTSPTIASKSPVVQQNLPSIQSQLGEQLGDLRDNPSHPNQGPSMHRLSFSSAGPAHSSPKEMNSIHTIPYSHSSQARPHPPPYSAVYSAAEQSPVSTTSAVSPREFRGAQSIRSMSPPKYASRQYHSNGLTPQSEAQTPLSAASTQPSRRTLSSDSSPGAETVGDLDRPNPPPGLSNGSIVTGNFKCDHPGCTALPFQTQYLLNSHANVHSSNRPHYCPVPTCKRSIGGKGFKRKNEMIRHGLVHQSPGYICPFCPERVHKYPRPDNLQRHVRVHHQDKHKDDPKLREVLSQRPEGGSRGRRRRANS